METEPKRRFMDLTSQECLEYYPQIVKNSEAQFAIAEILAEKEYYGPAISHIVLGGEELVKALIIFFDGIGFEIRKIDGIGDFFQFHRSRHLFNCALEMVSGFVSSVQDIITRFYMFQTEWAYPQTELDIALWKLGRWGTWDISPEKEESELKKLMKPYQEESTKCLAFWAIADKQKQKGFYVDYNDEIHTPEMVTKRAYEFAHEMANSTRTKITNYINNVVAMSEEGKKEFVISQTDAFNTLFMNAMETNKNLKKKKM